MVGGEGGDRRWDGWMASPTQWTWVWVNSGSWWWTGRPGMLRFMGLQRAGHDWATELNWTLSRLLRSQWNNNRFFFSVIPFFFPCDPTDVSNLISSSSAFSKSSFYIWKFSVHVLLKPSFRISKMTLLAQEMSLKILWHCLSLELEWKLTFSSPVPTAEFSKSAKI